MSRGILETIYVKLSPGKTAADLKKHLEETYKNEPFVHVLEGFVLDENLFFYYFTNLLIYYFTTLLFFIPIVLIIYSCSQYNFNSAYFHHFFTIIIIINSIIIINTTIFVNTFYFIPITSGALPQTRHVRGSNNCFINVVADRMPGRAIIVSAIGENGII